MYCILNVGMTGQGKTKFCKDMIKGKNCFVFDVQNEYTELPVSSFSKRGRDISLKEKEFIKKCSQKKDTICVFEEATGFFEGKTEPELRRIVLSKRHTGNIFIFNFHSLSSVPPRLMQFANFVILFRTLDEEKDVRKKFPSLVPYYLKARTLKIPNFISIKMIEQ